MASSVLAAARLAAVVVAASPVFAAAAHGDPSDPGAPSAAVRWLLDASGSPQPLCATEEGRALWAAVRAFYEGRSDRPAWTDGPRLLPAGERLRAALGAAADEGLDPSRYDPRRVVGAAPRILEASLDEQAAARAAAAWEVGLTVALARYATDLARGQVDPSHVSVLWRSRPRPFDVRSAVQEAADSGRPETVLEEARPVHPQYAALREALRVFAGRAAREPQIPLVPAGPALRPGARSPRVRVLRARLAFWGDLAAPAADQPGDVLDRATVEALKRFEASHGLPSDGILDPDAVAALNVPAAERARQIGLNLERWRWQERTGRGRSIVVNIPTFELHAYEDGREALAMRVISGRPETPTPVFAQDMTAVVFSPYWNVPANISADETLPAVLRDRAYLQRMNLEVLRGDEVVDPRRVDWRHEAHLVSFRQRPGAGNSLGLVKFLLPNPFNVYLHDTPTAALFERPRRAFSHGCVRLAKPEALARWVLGGLGGWTPARIAAAMRAGRESSVPLPQPIPVSISYFTVWVDGDGTVEFRPDVYRHDAAQEPLLAPARPDAGTSSVAAAG